MRRPRGESAASQHARKLPERVYVSPAPRQDVLHFPPGTKFSPAPGSRAATALPHSSQPAMVAGIALFGLALSGFAFQRGRASPS